MMRKETRDLQALAALDPTWRVIIEQRIAANRHWRHARRDLVIAEVIKRKPAPEYAVLEIPMQIEVPKR